MGSLLFTAFIYLFAAVVAVPLSKRLGLGSVLGYLLAGMIIGPALGLVGRETQEIQHVAEFGVVMMLFFGRARARAGHALALAQQAFGAGRPASGRHGGGDRAGGHGAGAALAGGRGRRLHIGALLYRNCAANLG